ncbi:hypothetical protein F4560_007889 [Saccharothrix ecbatanensis]|jgi:hypothetical protein|uniref:Secreted protein n=1 Tax=Saccharothrix ecbatanensis TaxID=1105145 RepID=A0A7W9M5F2_9PSEU|nr:hypothetical protein [Saccharothrix ecbatanensis]MBB5808121.1 hypothetical protein [Saccharothrix ecbatanensis]
MTRRALFAILAMIAGFVVSGPGPSAPGDLVAISAPVDGTHQPGTTTRGANAVHPVQVHLGQPLDGVQPAVHATPAPPVRVDVVDPTHRTPERNVQTPLGERAPPLTSGS